MTDHTRALPPSPYILGIRAIDRAAAYIVVACFVPLAIFLILCLTVMLGSAPSLDAMLIMLPALAYSFLSLCWLLAGFHVYCWLRS